MRIVGAGMDLVEMERVRKAVRRFGRRFLERCFTQRELAFCYCQDDPIPSLAARYAAKEAGAKALGSGIARGVGWREIEIERLPGARPMMIFHGSARRRAQSMRIARAHVTLTHDRQMAGAHVIAESDR